MCNTFVIIPDPALNPNYLDNSKLIIQKRDALKILSILENIDNAKLNNKYFSMAFISPNEINAVKMWIGYTNALKVYYNYIIERINFLGLDNKDVTFDIDNSLYNVVPCYLENGKAIFNGEFNDYSFPPWFSYPPFYMAHRSFLFLNNPVYYAQFYCEDLMPFLNYGFLWPSNCDSSIYITWSFSYLEAIKASVPAKYKYTLEEIQRWIYNNKVNPRTLRKIKEGSRIYKDLVNAAIGHGFIR